METPWMKGPLRVSENGSYLMEGEKPFFWLGDTAWLLLHRLDKEQVYTYLRNRKELGYNVIQTVLINSDDGRQELGNPAKDPGNQEYWEFCDWAVKLAEEMGLYMGLLPAWGSVVKQKVLNLDNVEAYMNFLGKRYQNSPNIIWILGGDIRGDVAPELFRKEGQILKSYNPERIITYHPFGRTTSAFWFHEEPWLDLNLFQSGHRRYDQAHLGEWDDNLAQEEFFGEDNWRYVKRDQERTIRKPVLDGEPSYEGIPKGLHDPRNGFWEEADARRYAYWSVFAGAAGHTYGNNAIMQFYDGSGEGSYGVREMWQEALHYPAGGQMQYLKKLMESVDFVHGKAADELLLFGQKERYHRIAVFAGRDYIFCYDHMGDDFLLDLSSYRDKTMDVYWMNPQSGAYSYAGTVAGQEKWLAQPLRRKGESNDWVLVMKERKTM